MMDEAWLQALLPMIENLNDYKTPGCGTTLCLIPRRDVERLQVVRAVTERIVRKFGDWAGGSVDISEEDFRQMDHAVAQARDVPHTSTGTPAHAPSLQQTLQDLEGEIHDKPNHAIVPVTVGRLRDVLTEMARLVKVERSARNLLWIGYEFDWAPDTIAEYVDALDTLIGVP